MRRRSGPPLARRTRSTRRAAPRPDLTIHFWSRLMHHSSKTGRLAAWAILGATSLAAAAAPLYHLTDTGLVGEGFGVNATGAITGQATVGAKPDAVFKWDDGNAVALPDRGYGGWGW